MFFNPGQMQSQMNSPMFAQLMQQMQGGGMMGNGAGQMQNMAPVLAIAQGHQASNGQAAPNPMQPRQSPQGGALGNAVQAGDNMSKLYGMGSDVGSAIGRGYNNIFGPSGNPPSSGQPLGNQFTGAAGRTNDQILQNFMGGQQNQGGMYGSQMGPGNFNGMQSPTQNMFGNSPGSLAGGNTSNMFGDYGASGMDASGASGQSSALSSDSMANGVASNEAASSAADSSSWLDQLWDWL